ncbi:tetratricopeptide repeat protein [Parapedobacter sp. SGR-10]|uniref:tetratricopeptide repeat-containing sensor histidine kinase n=1 Tax=Parapedobacter sp. SGR-10 TaxID=2710879 RepID=UPI0013D13AC0|nr:tetratricopeptide repeat protein [Parapedobacter sp. SGR-10]NGF55977.1 tetratricopeptide repeat protein [Parapedobacter sp. SGR-10]
MMEKHINKGRRQVYLFLLCLILVWTPALVSGQSLDSLEQVLATKKLSEEEKIKIYDDLSWFYTNIDVCRSIDFGQEGLALARKNKDEKMTAIFYRNLGVAYFMGAVLDTAAFYLEKARPIADKLKEHRLQASINNTYANIYRVQSSYDKALENYFATVKILDEQHDKKELGLVYSNIGGIYQMMSNFDQALKYFEMAEKLALEVGDQEGLAAIYISLSDIAYHQDKPKAVSVDYARKAVDIYRSTDNKYAGSKALQTLAKAHYVHDDYAAAEPIAQQAIAQAKELGFPILIAEALNIISNIHFHQGRYARSVEAAMESLKTDSTDLNITMNVYANLAQAYAYLGQPDLTKKYLHHYREVLNRYANESYQNSLSGMEVRYETEKKELKIEVLEKQRQLYIWLGIGAGLILLIALALAFIRYRLAVSRRKLAEEETQRLEQEKQLVAVQATLDGETAERTRLAKDLHDGLGSMLSLVKFNLPQVKEGEAAVLEGIDVNRFQKALGMLDDSIQELRRVAHHMMPESLLRYGLKASLSDFCSAIPIADFHYFGDEARLSEKLEIMIYRCIHELVNNALKHAQAKHINVQLVQEQDRISFTVQDDGVGFDQEQVVEGMGLKNVRQRVAAFQGKMNIYSSSQGTEIHVELEFTKKEEND